MGKFPPLLTVFKPPSPKWETCTMLASKDCTANVAQQTVAEAVARSRSYPKTALTLVHWVAKFWAARASWARYLLFGKQCGVPELVDFARGNGFFVAWQVRDELIALGEILALKRPERAVEIGTARGGTLFFLTRLASPRATIVSVDLPGGGVRGWLRRRRRVVLSPLCARWAAPRAASG